MKQPEFNTYNNLHQLAERLVIVWGKRKALVRAAELCENEHFREFNIMREYIQQF